MESWPQTQLLKEREDGPPFTSAGTFLFTPVYLIRHLPWDEHLISCFAGMEFSPRLLALACPGESFRILHVGLRVLKEL